MLVGAQDVSRFGPGAHTGETTAEVLAELGCRLVMIGHPERARDQHETLDDCRGKATAAARNGIVPVLIAGEPTRGADMPDGIFLGRGGLAPENFLATVDAVRSAS